MKAVRFVLAAHSQLKYGARLINSYLGSNATISCCEVLNSLIFPSHEQHHNNSFLCAAVVMGQSNIAAGATIGSNHNSRAADGEIIANRGFWPGLCVSLKHNSKFATFTILAKGDYPAELNIPLPFSLVSNDVAKDELLVMPAYWFMYNMYALSRNAWKYVDRDNRIEKIQHLEYDFLAPDSINEMFNALQCLELFTGKAYLKRQHPGQKFSDDEMQKTGKQLLDGNDPLLKDLQVCVTGFENSKRKVVICKPAQAYGLYKELISYYGQIQLIGLIEQNNIGSLKELQNIIPQDLKRTQWLNVGGQLMKTNDVDVLKQQVKDGTLNSWDELHAVYAERGDTYATDKMMHALASLQEIKNIDLSKIDQSKLNRYLDHAVATHQWMVKGIYDSRAKDYDSSFRKMVYENNEEMNRVMGRLDKNSFIQQEEQKLQQFRDKIKKLSQAFNSQKVGA